MMITTAERTCKELLFHSDNVGPISNALPFLGLREASKFARVNKTFQKNVEFIQEPEFLEFKKYFSNIDISTINNPKVKELTKLIKDKLCNGTNFSEIVTILDNHLEKMFLTRINSNGNLIAMYEAYNPVNIDRHEYLVRNYKDGYYAVMLIALAFIFIGFFGTCVVSFAAICVLSMKIKGGAFIFLPTLLTSAYVIGGIAAVIYSIHSVNKLIKRNKKFSDEK